MFGSKNRCVGCRRKISWQLIAMRGSGQPWTLCGTKIISKSCGRPIAHLGEFGRECPVLERQARFAHWAHGLQGFLAVRLVTEIGCVSSWLRPATHVRRQP